MERSFAHCYETGGMRRCHLRGRDNILKRQLVHVGAFNLSLILRKLLGAGTPARELKIAGAGSWYVLFCCSRTGIVSRDLVAAVSPGRSPGASPDRAYPHFEHPSEGQHARNRRPCSLRKVAGHAREESDDHPDFDRVYFLDYFA